jgi:uncharacterized protein with von Willebrand factor type A (vWA) domain
MKRTSPHRSYAEPTRLDIQSRFNELGFEGAYSYDLVRDIANAYSHVQAGGMVSSSFEDILSQLGQIPNDEEELQEFKKQLDYHKNVQSFLNTLDFNAFTGDTPLQKAASIVAALSSQEGGEGDEGEGIPLPIFTEGESSVKEKIEKLQEDVKRMLDANKDASRYIFNPNDKAPEVALASLGDKQRDLLAKMAILGDRGKIKARRTSATQTVEQMSEYSQIARISNMTAIGMPTFGYKFATKQLIVKNPKQSGKQLLFFLIDASGSMRDEQKQQWVKALLLNRCDAVCKNEGELYIAFYLHDVDLDKCIKLSTKTEVKEFLKNFWTFGMHSGSTDIERSVKNVCQAIEEGKLGKHKLASANNPQIVVINDGEDRVNANYKPSVMTNCFILGQDNSGMKSMVENCGGHYERFL